MNPTENSDTKKALRQAVRLHRHGDLVAAANQYAEIVDKEPTNADALHLMGVLARQQEDDERAARLIRQAICLAPDAALYYVSLGDLYRSPADLKKRIACYRQALQIDPNLVAAWCNLGNAYGEGKRHKAAIDCYQRALESDAGNALLYNNLGRSFLALEAFPQAAAAFEQALAIQTDYTDARINLGNTLRDHGCFSKAQQCYAKALAAEPDNAVARYSRGICFQRKHQYDQAKKCYQAVLRNHPDHYGVHSNMGKLCHDQNEFQTALSWYEKAIRIDPKRGEARFYRALVLLTLGRFDEGWRAYEARFERRSWRKVYPHRLPLPRWNGESLAGKTLLVHMEQGFGDAIQFARFLPLLKTKGCRVVFEVRPELLELFGQLAGVDRLIPLSSHPPSTADIDFYIPLLSLPLMFQTRMDTIPVEVPYLRAAPEKVPFWQARLGNANFNVGLVWWAKPTYRHDKSCSLALLAPLFKIPHVRIYGLQKHENAQKRETLPVHVHNLGDLFTSFADTAAAIDCLDLVISVDTAVAHLAGALGKTVWTLLPFGADWRWFIGRDDSPWYPTMRLFRQAAPGDWAGVAQAVTTDLSRQIDSNLTNLKRRDAAPI
jgi:tetratricopeptide (TPR) repeat protein